MFEHLDDPDPPTFGSRALNQVERRCEARQRRIRVGAISGITVPSLVIGGVLLARATADAPERVVTTQPEPVTTPESPSPTSVEVATSTVPSAPSTVEPEPEPEFPLLGDRSEPLADDEWLLPLVMPGGLEIRNGSVQYGLVAVDESRSRLDEAFGVSRQLDWYDSDPSASSAWLNVEISADPLSAWFGYPGAASTEREIAGQTWELFGIEERATAESESVRVPFGPLEARRKLGDSTIFVRTNDEVSDEEWTAAIASLAIVPRSALDVPILDERSPGVLRVASTDFDGVVTTLGVERFDGTSCFYVTPGSQDELVLARCLPDLAVDGVMTEVGFPDAHHPGGSSTMLEVRTFGMVRADVASVELLMFNDQIVTLKPIPAAGMDEKFWLLADSFEIGQRLDVGEFPVFLPPTIQSITAYDADGNVLAVEVAEDGRDEN